MGALKLVMVLNFALFAPPAGMAAQEAYFDLQGALTIIEAVPEVIAATKAQAALATRCAGCLRQIDNADEYPGRWNSSQKSCVDAPSGQCTPLSV